jgi:hypothetical protein
VSAVNPAGFTRVHACIRAPYGKGTPVIRRVVSRDTHRSSSNACRISEPRAPTPDRSSVCISIRSSVCISIRSSVCISIRSSSMRLFVLSRRSFVFRASSRTGAPCRAPRGTSGARPSCNRRTPASGWSVEARRRLRQRQHRHVARRLRHEKPLRRVGQVRQVAALEVGEGLRRPARTRSRRRARLSRGRRAWARGPCARWSPPGAPRRHARTATVARARGGRADRARRSRSRPKRGDRGEARAPCHRRERSAVEARRRPARERAARRAGSPNGGRGSSR